MFQFNNKQKNVILQNCKHRLGPEQTKRIFRDGHGIARKETIRMCIVCNKEFANSKKYVDERVEYKW